MSWEERTLDQCATFQSGGTPRKSRAEYWGGDIPWVSSGEMTESFLSETSLNVTDLGAKNGTRRVPENTILVVVRGMSLAKEFRISITKREMTFNQDIKALKCADDVDANFLFYALKAKKEQIRDRATDASHGTKKLDMAALTATKIPLPKSIETQKKIARVAANYDDLIENNRRRIALLEEAARLIYREWFVHFRFPNFENTKFENGLPAGWEKTNVSNLSAFISRGITPKYDEEANGLVVNQKCIRHQRLSLSLARRQSKKVPKDKMLQKFDLLVNSTGTGTLGRVAQVMHDPEDTTVDSHVTIVRPCLDVDAIWFGQVLFDLEKTIETLGRGATNQTELSKDDLGQLTVFLPPKILQSAFAKMVANKREAVQILLVQNQALTKARDLLLPRLMDGRIAV